MTENSYIGLNTARKLPSLLRDGNRPDLSTLWRWAMRGCRGQRLQTWFIGGRRVTTEAAVNDFLARLASPQDSKQPEEVGSGHRLAMARLAVSGIA